MSVWIVFNCQLIYFLSKENSLSISTLEVYSIELLPFFVDFVEFTDEEGYGKYLDLHEVYDKFLNLRGVEVSLNLLKWQIRNTVFLDLFFIVFKE